MQKSIRGRGGKSGTRKYGRNKVKCEHYKLYHRKEKNKIRRLQKYCKKAVNDRQTRSRLAELLKEFSL